MAAPASETCTNSLGQVRPRRYRVAAHRARIRCVECGEYAVVEYRTKRPKCCSSRCRLIRRTRQNSENFARWYAKNRRRHLDNAAAAVKRRRGARGEKEER